MAQDEALSRLKPGFEFPWGHNSDSHLQLQVTVFFWSNHETIVPTFTRKIAPWRARLFGLMSKNATSATEFFKIPTNRVVELGTQLVI